MVVDDDVEAALGAVRAHWGKVVVQDARIAREAVFEGAILSALIGAASAADGEERVRASGVLATLREVLPTLSLPQTVVKIVTEKLDVADSEQAASDRRDRQLALLGASNPHGRAALDFADGYDAVDAAG